MDRAKFFAALRKRGSGVFGTSLSQSQVDGLENLLDVQAAYLPDMPLDELAYNLGTAFHETAGTMQPITERGQRSYFNKYEPGTRIGKILGNNETLAYGAYTGGDVDLVSMTLNQIDALQTKMLKHPKNKLRSSALGAGRACSCRQRLVAFGDFL